MRQIWKERELLISRNKDIKHKKEILQLPEAVNLPTQVAIMHYPEHQKNGSQTSQGNRTADKAPRQATWGLPILESLNLHLDLGEFKPHYRDRAEKWAHEWVFLNNGPNSIWKINTHGIILLPEAPVSHPQTPTWREPLWKDCFYGPR